MQIVTVEQARNIFDAVVGMAGPTQALFEAQAADSLGDLSDEDLMTVIQDYVTAKAHLDNLLATGGVIG